MSYSPSQIIEKTIALQRDNRKFESYILIQFDRERINIYDPNLNYAILETNINLILLVNSRYQIFIAVQSDMQQQKKIYRILGDPVFTEGSFIKS